ncbi:hypothetical protein ACFLWI_06940, partial [Chloroflexota bacterium]
LAMLQLAKENYYSVDQIERIEHRQTPRPAFSLGYKTMGTGVLSVRYLVAIAALMKQLNAASVSIGGTPEVLDLMSKVNVIEDESVPHLDCNLTVILKDGRTLAKEYAANGGKFCYNLDDEIEWLSKQFLSEMAVEADNANSMIGLVRELENCGDIGQLTKLLVSPGRKSPRYRIVF